MTAEQIVNDWKHAMEESFYDVKRVPLKPGVKEFLNWLHFTCPMVLCYIATSNVKPVVQHALELHGVAGYFQDIVTSTDVPKPKPNPDVYTEVVSRAAAATGKTLKNSDVLVVEDNYQCAMGAKKVGMKICAVQDAHPVNMEHWSAFTSAADMKVTRSFSELILPLRSSFLHEFGLPLTP